MNEIHKKKKVVRLILLSAFLLFGITASNAVTRYVTTTGSGNGSSWANASNDPQAMINASASGDEVWIAAGTYTPTHSAENWTEAAPTGVNSNLKDQHNSFVLKSGVKVYGGFAGGETNLSQRNWIGNRTILSGDFDGNDYGNDPSHVNSSENAYHVVIAANNTVGTLLDGFTVWGGNYNSDYVPHITITVNGEDVYNRNGGGIYAIRSAATICNLEIRRNGALNGGGLFCVKSDDFRGYNLIFFKNFAGQGGGMYVKNNPKFKNIILSANEAGIGTAISNTQSDWQNGEGRTTPHYINAFIQGNYGSPVHGYGAVQNEASDPVFTNCTFGGNYGGTCPGLYNYVQSYPVLNNTIIWNNLTSDQWGNPVYDENNQAVFANVYNSGDSFTKYNNCIVQGMDLQNVTHPWVSGSLSTNCIDATVPGFDPKFINMPSYYWTNNGGSFTLQDDSPCIDSGDKDLYIAACGDNFLGWDNESSVTPPPYTPFYDYYNAFYGTWTPRDKYSDLPVLRLSGDAVDIGVFEWYPIVVPPCDPTTRYVKPNGSGSKDGSSWANASDDVQEMINISCSGSEIWVAAGTYLPTHSASGWTDNNPSIVNPDPSDRNNAFVLKSGVKVYGGFAGNETSLDQRDWINNVTTLSGDFNGDDINNVPDVHSNYSVENAFHVVISANNDEGTILDGFTIRGGNIYGYYNDVTLLVNGENVYNKDGGGMYIINSSARISNLVVRNNAAPGNGAGIYCINSDGLRGHNLYIYKNLAGLGGGMQVKECSPKFKNIMISENQAEQGGGLSIQGYQTDASLVRPEFINMVVHSNMGNPQTGGSAGIHNFYCTPVFTNASVVGNYGGYVAIGICNHTSFPILNNSIVWNNIASTFGQNNVADVFGSVSTYNYSVVYGMDLSANGGLDATAPGFDPMFINNPVFYMFGSYGNFTLQNGSPLIDAGSNELYEAACGDWFDGWDNEMSVTPPPFTPMNTNAFDSFFGAWYPSDKYSGKKTLRNANGRINIGAFEEFTIPKLVDHLEIDLLDPDIYIVNTGAQLNVYANITPKTADVKIGLFKENNGEFFADIVSSKQSDNIYVCQMPSQIGTYMIAPYYEEDGVKIKVQRSESYYIDRLLLKVARNWGTYSLNSVSEDTFMQYHLTMINRDDNAPFYNYVRMGEKFDVDAYTETDNVKIGLYNLSTGELYREIPSVSDGDGYYECQIPTRGVMAGSYVLIPFTNEGLVERAAGEEFIDRIPITIRPKNATNAFAVEEQFSVAGIQDAISDMDGVKQIEVYTLTGQKVTTIAGGQGLNIDYLKPDTYIIKVVTEKDVFSYKLLKK